ncbi:hypothetical protein [Methanosarcina mazei]|jgi:DNA-binding LytR/AlgR family response regulator|uniref:Uncharacterized protein n=3 Tax=Methanosarcina mazei TaxID=2209 RepID=A0A0F8PAG6_METMZ|nr:hypothetical protein [Methanosarcina mazei]KKG06625.1 hypothetical protein DU47_00920 [Methanosarcina mazei]KKG33050.1 hypothetical protein DU52_09065 [Methanosarcina mazei]KKG35442.1 hypothetical protein DU30_01610 [Methanosarcina mazei]KKG56354.1 hypothetical protein DU33_01025 [Methanosarcina mazei]KKG58479.1 hypothetical protein DU45_08810 [Methanosarcina mazei]
MKYMSKCGSKQVYNYRNAQRLQARRSPERNILQPFSPAGVMMRLPRLQLNTIIILPVSEIVIFEDASHQHHLEKTDEYLKVVRNFIDKAEKRQMFTPLKTPIPLK